MNLHPKETELFPTISQYTLYISVLLVIIGQLRITDHNTKILYSLCMLIGSAVGRYGTEITYLLTKYPKDALNKTKRRWTYTILWFFGILGLLF